MRQVKMLREGDTVGMVAPAGPVVEREQIEKAVKAIKELGFQVVVGPGCYEKWGYLAGSDEVRAKDINSFFANPEIDGIFCMRGGNGSPRIVDKLDLKTISRNPKVFLGYSDITSLHLVLNHKAHFMTFHGPMPTTEFIKPDFVEYAREQLVRALMSPEPLGEIASPNGAPPIETMSPGNAEGELVGGNLALICALMGTPFEIDTRGKILLLEDIYEENYRIDRLLTQLRLAGKFEDATGIVIGEFTEWEPKEPHNYLPIKEVLESILLPYNKPILKNVSFGHGKYKATLPLGALAQIDGGRSRLVVLESGVIE